MAAWDTEQDEVSETIAERLVRIRKAISDPQKQHPKKLATPSSWQPGQSGNPGGRPHKDQCVTSLAKELLNKPADLPPDAPEAFRGMTWGQLIAYNFVTTTAKIIPPVLKEFLDRTEGKVPQPVTGEGGGPVEIKVVYD